MFEELFSKIGNKLKILAKILLVVLSILFIIVAIIVFAEFGEDLYWLGFLLILGGPVFSYVICMFIYAFGELVTKTSDIERNTKRGTADQANFERKEKLDKMVNSGLISETEYKQLLTK